ncbi:MAG: hypothetical protein M3173_09305 [Chloroflexota bacterium]|nr:hypothetical protein [Chloroflexota bacterium]
MVAEQTLPELTYSGNDSQKSLADRVFQLIRAQGMFASDYAPIRVKLGELATFLEVTEEDVRGAVEANADIFVLEDGEEVTWVISTRLGTPPVEMVPDTKHTFTERLMTPESAPERPLRTERPVPDTFVPTEVGAAVDDAREEEIEVEAELREEGIEVDEDVTVELVTPEAAPEAPAEAEAVEPEHVVEEEADVAAEAFVEAVPESAEELEQVAEAATGASDLSGYDDDAVAEAVRQALGNDPRVANFADQWMAEDRVERLSRGNLRGLADYINEQEQPLTDDVLVQDVLGVRRSASDFETMRFSMNYRLSSERGFEFLGTTDQPFWGTTDLPPIGTTRRKASDIGTDYRYLVDEVPAGSVEPRSVKTVEHTLSFYEFTYGVLPLDAQMQALLPAPMMPDQRSAVLMVEIPQFENSVYLVEVRYPTHNRGGFILGLDDFYEEKLVPGAMLSIEATDNDGQYKIEYLEDEERQDRFLELDDRRAPKYVFRPLSYDTAVDSDWLITEDRFPRFGNEKPLSERQRRRIEEVIEETFRRVGDKDGDTWYATFTDLLVAMNVERPASEAMLREAIESMPSVTDDGSGMLTYDALA